MNEGCYSYNIYNDNQKIVKMSKSIPAQKMRVVQYKARFVDVAAALAAKKIYFQIPHLKSNNIIDDNENFSRIPLSIRETATETLIGNCNIEFQTNATLEEVHTINLYDYQGLPLSGIEAFEITFDISYGSV